MRFNESDSEEAQYRLLREMGEKKPKSESVIHELYKNSLNNAFFENDITQKGGVLHFSPQKRARGPSKTYSSSSLCGDRVDTALRRKREINKKPERALNAVGLVDDFYLNLLDWSSTDLVAIAMGRDVYVWNNYTEEATKMLQLENEFDYVTSLKWHADGRVLALGTASNTVQLWDAGKQKKLREEAYHSARVSSMSWNNNVLSTGGKDHIICNVDIRSATKVSSFQGHDGEICGLQWSPDGSKLASGSNDDKVMIWENSSGNNNSNGNRQANLPNTALHVPLMVLKKHIGAVKALAWCPWKQDLLATGGGSIDKHINMWNTKTGECEKSVNTQSQVCAIVWNKQYRELASSHGTEINQVAVWKYSSMTKLVELSGHTARALHMTQSPDGSSVVSAGGDTMCFWKLWEKREMPTQGKYENSPISSASRYRTLSVR
tara:strand:- start:401 stop:1705 length:1305 start_codon:yes stop_codon:yes gene_type:complete